MVEFRNTSGIFLRIDSSGNLGVFNQSGTEIATFIGGLFSGIFNKASLAAQASRSTTSVSSVSTSDGVSLTPQISTRVLVITSYTFADLTTADAIGNVGLWFNTTGIPAVGAAATGTQFYGLSEHDSKTAITSSNPYTAVALVTGLTIGTAYFFYTSFASPVGTDTVNYKTISITAIEI